MRSRVKEEAREDGDALVRAVQREARWQPDLKHITDGEALNDGRRARANTRMVSGGTEDVGHGHIVDE